MALLQRLDRLEAAAQHVESGLPHGRTTRDAATAPDAAAANNRLTWVVTGVISGVLLAALILLSVGDQGTAWLGMRRDARTVAPARAEEPVPVPTASELSIARARALHARGHLRDALIALKSVRYGDRFRAEADELRAAIQQELLAAGRAGQPAGNVTAAQSPQ
jgi:hypothetical protein